MPCKSIKIWLLLGLVHGTVGKKHWDYEPVSLVTYSTDDSQMKIESKIDRLKRGEFGLSCTLEWKYDIDETTMVESSAYQSTSGAEKDYKELPWAVPKQTFYEYLDKYYMDVTISNLGHCSNLPQFEGKFQPPWPKDTYHIDKCVFDGEGLPEVLAPGFYKIVFIVTGTNQPEWGFTIVLKITNKMF
ncbi:uncharacterized protein [Drosophila pseudoobscura]|uniref:Uncharacterized protein n=1 Tax=Drosophila pseudoobscura pseudoobscura TaxID=46245 RepID=A0A6I8V4T3_DROPS|nr:uncharacterized protein LOC6898652 [Drosophila pseudoobscura]